MSEEGTLIVTNALNEEDEAMQAQCSHCGALLEVGAILPGLQVRCAACSQVVTVKPFKRAWYRRMGDWLSDVNSYGCMVIIDVAVFGALMLIWHDCAELERRTSGGSLGGLIGVFAFLLVAIYAAVRAKR